MVEQSASFAGNLPRIIDSTRGVSELADRLMSEPVIAMDTESDSMYHYREKVCLIQLSSPGTGSVIVDPLSDADVSPLGVVMATPGITKVLHGSDFDITSLKRDFGWEFAGLFDTAIAARFLGQRSFGLAAVVAAELGVRMEKGEQTSDWSIRPLPERMLRYASGDVDYLVDIHARLAARLAGMDRLEWVIEESEAVGRIHAASELPAPADFLKAGASRDLAPDRLAILRELFAVREAICLDLDRPRFKLVSDDALVAIAAVAPRTVDELRAMPRVPHNILAHPSRWLKAIAVGLESPPVQITRPHHRWAADPRVSAAVERLRSFRQAASERLDLEPGLLLPNRLISAIALAGPTDVQALSTIDGIRQWRCRVIGDELVAAATGLNGAK